MHITELMRRALESDMVQRCVLHVALALLQMAGLTREKNFDFAWPKHIVMLCLLRAVYLAVFGHQVRVRPPSLQLDISEARKLIRFLAGLHYESILFDPFVPISPSGNLTGRRKTR